MWRRSFLALACSTAFADNRARRLTRTSKLVEGSAKINVQDVFFANGLFYCLHLETATRKWGVTVTTLQGETVRHHDLPNGIYFALGLRFQELVLQAMTYYDPAGHAHPFCMLRLDSNGNLEMLGDAPTHKLFFAGDYLVHVNKDSAEVYRADQSSVAHLQIAPNRGSTHFDMISPNLLALTRPEGTGITFLDLPSGSVREEPITGPEVESAVASNKGGPFTTTLVATGSDGNGHVRAVVSPSLASALQVVDIDVTGRASLSLTLELPRMGVMKLVCAGSELGVLAGDGSAVWYDV